MRGSHKVLLLSALGLISQASSILLGVVLVRFLTQDQYGTFRQAYFLTETVAYIFTIALPASLLFLLPNLNPGEKKGLIRQTLWALATLGLVGSLLLWIFSGFVARLFGNPELMGILAFFSFYPFFHVTIQHVPAMFMGLDKFKTGSWYQLFTNLAKFVVICAAVLLGAELGLLMKIVLAYMAIQMILVVGLSSRELQGVPAIWRCDLLTRQFQYAIPLGVSSIIWFVGKEIDKYCVAAFVSPSEYALFAVGALEIPLFHEISIAISVVVVPKIAQLHHEKNHDEIAGLWREIVRKSMLIFIPSFAVLFLIAKPLIGVLYTPQYLAASSVFQVYLGLILLRTFNSNIILQGVGKTKIVLLNSILFVVVNTALNLYFLKVLKMGIIGPAIATLVAYFIMNLAATLAAMHYLKVRFLQILPIKDFLKLSGLALAAYGVTYLSLDGIGNLILKVSAHGVGFGILFLVGALTMKLYSLDDLNLILGKLARKN